MVWCDSSLGLCIRERYYDDLLPLSPLDRYVRMLQYKLEAVELKIEKDDEIFGWIHFHETPPENIRPFPQEAFSPQEQQILDAPHRFLSRCSVDNGHTLMDYEEILQNGLMEYDRRIRARRQQDPNNEYLRAMEDTLQVVKAFCHRIVSCIEARLAVCPAEDVPRLSRMREAMVHVPWQPARNFHEAVQSVWIIHLLLPLAGNDWYSISLGRFDQFMYPFYQKSLADGMTLPEATAIMHNFYRLLNGYADAACLLNVGSDYNDLSLQLIRWHRDFAMPGPILGARISPQTPPHILHMLIDEKLFSMGQPTFYSETSCLAALAEKGLPPEEARRFSNNSCMAISIPGAEFNSMWGCVFPVSAALEAAVNEGRVLTPHADYTVPNMAPADSLSALYDRFEACAAHMMNVSLQQYHLLASHKEQTDPQPFASLLMEDCIEKGCDRISGAKYHTVTVECMGMVNVGDGLCAIDHLVFRQKRYTLAQITQAVCTNFAHHPDIRKAILDCPRFGRDPEADEYTLRVADILQRIIRSHSCDHMYFSPSLHTLDSNVYDGANWGAGYDGRLSGEPFAKNAGPSNCARQSVPTAMVLAASALPQQKFFGGQPLDVCFPADAVQNRKAEIAALIQTYFSRGALQFQVNSISSRLLRQAMENPQAYPDLVVRIGGYSTYFRHISPQTQREFVERFEKEGL